MRIKTIEKVFDLVNHAHSFHKKIRNQWQSVDNHQYKDISNRVAITLLKSGLKKGDHVITILGTQPEWNYLDMGILQSGGVHVSLSNFLNNEELKHILEITGAKFAFVARKTLKKRLEDLSSPALQQIISVDQLDDQKTLSKWIRSDILESDVQLLEESKATIQNDDLAAVVFTSGTTSKPKGVMLTHENLAFTINTFTPLLQIKSNFRALSQLPLNSMGARKLNYAYQLSGIPIFYKSPTQNLLQNLSEIRPYITEMVPYQLAEIYQLLKKGKTTSHNSVHSFKEKLGGNLERMVCGGAAIPEYLHKFYQEIQIPVNEVYGLSETSALVSFNQPGSEKYGSAGQIAPGVDINISEDDEILCHGKNIMKGYLAEPEQTAKTLTKDGWLHTGDIGKVDQDGYLWITGRKKNRFKTLQGVYIDPEYIENKLTKSPFIDQLMVVGENRPELAALIVPNFEQLMTWSRDNKINILEGKEQIEHHAIRKLYQQEIHRLSRTLKPEERIFKFKLIGTKWTNDSGHLSTLMKIKRSKIANTYRTDIDALYDHIG